MNGSSITKNRKYQRLGIGLGVFIGVAVTLIHPALAIARGYATDDPQLKTGMVAALSDESTPESPKAERASISNDNAIIGITAALGSDLATVVSDDDQVYVQSTGEVNAFVADINGMADSGDPLTLSPLKGILMKADETTNQPVIGVALQPFEQGNIENRTVRKDSGEESVKISMIRVSLDHRAFTGNTLREEDSYLQKLSMAITGERVSEIRVLAAIIIFIIALVVEGGIIYGAVTSSITALGRNPLAKNIIIKEVGKVILVAVFVMAIGVAGIYSLLWI